MSVALKNGGVLPLERVPLLCLDDFWLRLVRGMDKGGRIAAFFGGPAPLASRSTTSPGSRPASGQNSGSDPGFEQSTVSGSAPASGPDSGPGSDQTRLTMVLADDASGLFDVFRCDVGRSYPSVTRQYPQAHLFEREIFEQWGVEPVGHPWLKPVRFEDRRSLGGEREPVGVTQFFRVEGQEVHEVAVGPIHAGVIEPGHFRFQCHGETVFHLEISLGYQHRGVEKYLTGGPDKRAAQVMETVAGDTTIGHATAWSRIMERLGGADAPDRAEAIRAVALELERLANHTGDLGALAGDVGYLPTSSFCGRLRGDFLNMSALLCGSRFGRALVRPGGVRFDLDEPLIAELSKRLEATMRDVRGAAELLFASPSVQDRFEGVGVVSRETALSLGLVGPAARASGLNRDARRDFHAGGCRCLPVEVVVRDSGDVHARAMVRWLEIQESAAFIRKSLAALPPGPVMAPASLAGRLAPDSLCLALVEGWRGEICHVCLTDADGRVAQYKIVDPSFHNWTGLAMALRNQQISDFPLCNKSFNLSYCGYDL